MTHPNPKNPMGAPRVTPASSPHGNPARARLGALAASLGALALLAGSGCVGETPGDHWVQLVGNVIPDDSCTVKTAGGGQQVFLHDGRLDLAVTNNYRVFMMMNNTFEQFESLTGFQPEDLRLDPSTLLVKGLEVTLHFPAAIGTEEAQIVPFHQEAGTPAAVTDSITYKVHDGTTIGPGEAGIVIVDVIPAHVGQALRAIPLLLESTALFVMDLKAFGETAAGVEFKSAAFRYPIKVCNSCMVAHFFPDAVAANPFNQPDDQNNLTEEDLVASEQPVCNPGNDFILTNAWCGAFTEGGTCERQRCLGELDGGNEGTGANGGLTCLEDSVFIANDNLGF